MRRLLMSYAMLLTIPHYEGQSKWRPSKLATRSSPASSTLSLVQRAVAQRSTPLADAPPFR